jgi:hypothetical protein
VYIVLFFSLSACHSTDPPQSESLEYSGLKQTIEALNQRLNTTEKQNHSLTTTVRELSERTRRLEERSKTTHQPSELTQPEPKTNDLAWLRRRERVGHRYWIRIEAFRAIAPMDETQLEILVDLVGQEKDKVFALLRETAPREVLRKRARKIRRVTDDAVKKKLGAGIGNQWFTFRRDAWFKIHAVNK